MNRDVHNTSAVVTRIPPALAFILDAQAASWNPQFDRRQYPLFFYGNAAAKNIVRQLFARPILLHPQQTQDWLIPALGLDCYRIARRQYHGPAKEFSPEAMQEALANPTPPRRRLLP
jgi:hypothetical protein